MIISSFSLAFLYHTTALEKNNHNISHLFKTIENHRKNYASFGMGLQNSLLHIFVKYCIISVDVIFTLPEYLGYTGIVCRGSTASNDIYYVAQLES